MNLLLAESNSTNAWIIREYFEALGHQVDVAKNGIEVLKLFQRGYDAIILNVYLPRVHGLDVARIIRRKETKKNVLLGISTWGASLKRACINAGFNNVYHKTDLLEGTKHVRKTLHDSGSSSLPGGM